MSAEQMANQETAEGSSEEGYTLEQLKNQLELADYLAQRGAYTVITKENFEAVWHFDRGLLIHYKLDAIATRITINDRKRGMFPDQSDLFEEEITKLYGLTNKLFETTKDKEPSYNPWFNPSHEERYALLAALDIGVYSIINEKMFPSLAALPKEEVVGLQVHAITKLIGRWESIKGEYKNSTGFGEAEGSSVNGFLDTKMDQLLHERDALLLSLDSPEDSDTAGTV